jgi:hypothetical protein
MKRPTRKLKNKRKRTIRKIKRLKRPRQRKQKNLIKLKLRIRMIVNLAMMMEKISCLMMTLI